MPNKLAAITGASAGLGKSLAREYASKGYDLLLIARRESLLQDLKQEVEGKHKVSVSYEVCDLSKPAQYEALAKKLASYPIDTFINNAGVSYYSAIIDQDVQRQSEMVMLLINSLMYLTTAVGQQMAKRGGGTIVNISSGLAYPEFAPMVGIYAAAKKFVRDVSRAMNFENEKLGNKVRVVTVQPGRIATEFQAASSASRAPGSGVGPNAASVGMGDPDDFAKDTVAKILAGQNDFHSGPVPAAVLNAKEHDPYKAADEIWTLMKRATGAH